MNKYSRRHDFVIMSGKSWSNKLYMSLNDILILANAPIGSELTIYYCSSNNFNRPVYVLSYGLDTETKAGDFKSFVIDTGKGYGAEGKLVIKKVLLYQYGVMNLYEMTENELKSKNLFYVMK